MTLAQIEPYKIYIILGLIGLVAGWLSGLLLGGGGLLRNLVVGVLGAFVGGLLVEHKLLNLPKMPVVDQIPYGNQIVVATIGAILITIFARVIAGSR
jgi:uncharacterized membrane protein YeaQ/YmgE (transglycosylase-associated protein family)